MFVFPIYNPFDPGIVIECPDDEKAAACAPPPQISVIPADFICRAPVEFINPELIVKSTDCSPELTVEPVPPFPESSSTIVGAGSTTVTTPVKLGVPVILNDPAVIADPVILPPLISPEEVPAP